MGYARKQIGSVLRAFCDFEEKTLIDLKEGSDAGTHIFGPKGRLIGTQAVLGASVIRRDPLLPCRKRGDGQRVRHEKSIYQSTE